MEDLRFRVGIRKFQFRVSGFRVEDLRFRVGSFSHTSLR